MKMKHTMKLNDAPYDMIKSGQKTVELRLYDEKRRMISVGDEIEFVCEGEDEQEALKALVEAIESGLGE